MGISRLPGLSLAINKGRPPYPILGDPGAVSRAGRKGATKVFEPRWKSPWVRTLTGSFPNSQANAGSWLASKNALYYCAQSANSFSWVLFVTRRPFLISRHSCLVCSPSFPYQKWRCYQWVGKLGAISRSNSICTEKILFLTDHNVS